MKTIETFTKETIKEVGATENAIAVYLNSSVTNFFSHSLVFFSAATANGNVSVYNVLSNCRKSDINSIVKCFTRTYLSVENKIYNFVAQDKTFKVINPLRCLLSCVAVAVTDKDGKILPSSVFSVADIFGIEKFSKLFNFKKGLGIYDNVVINNLTWDNEQVQKSFTDYVVTIRDYIGLMQNIGATIIETAKLNEKSFAIELSELHDNAKKLQSMYDTAKENYNKANIALEAANKAVKDDTSKNKSVGNKLKKAAAAAAAAAKDAESYLAKVENNLKRITKTIEETEKAA